MSILQFPRIPYFQTSRYRVQAMVDLAEPKPGEKGADLGSGDGRIVIAFAKLGVLMHGYELDPKLQKVSEKKIKDEDLTNAVIDNKDLWQENLSEYSIITLYGMPDIMEPLEKKLKNELRPGTRVVSNYYQFPNWQHQKEKDNIYLYIVD